MDQGGAYDQLDAAGFIRIHAIRLKAHDRICRKRAAAAAAVAAVVATAAAAATT